MPKPHSKHPALQLADALRNGRFSEDGNAPDAKDLASLLQGLDDAAVMERSHALKGLCGNNFAHSKSRCAASYI